MSTERTSWQSSPCSRMSHVFARRRVHCSLSPRAAEKRCADVLFCTNPYLLGVPFLLGAVFVKPSPKGT